MTQFAQGPLSASDLVLVSLAPTTFAGSDTCVLHPFELADHICHQCGNWHCDGCVVHPWGPRKPALCVACAIGRGGVRKNSGMVQARTAKEIRRIERQERKQSREAARRPVVITSNGIDRSGALAEPDTASPRRGVRQRFGLF